jgi:hypothetical protein
MFVGHYGPALVGAAAKKTIPLWVLFLAVQLLDVFWSIFVLLGIEKVRIVPGITVAIFTTCRTRTVWWRRFFGLLRRLSFIVVFDAMTGGWALDWWAGPSSRTGCWIFWFIVPIWRCTTTASK